MNSFKRESLDGFLDLIQRMPESARIESILEEGLALACDLTGARAGALSQSETPSNNGPWVVRYNNPDVGNFCTGGGKSSVLDGPAVQQDSAAGRIVSLLRCGGRTVGSLTLWPDSTNAGELCGQNLTRVQPLLALLVASCRSVHTGFGLLDYAMYCNRITTEVSRAERTRSEFAVMRVLLDYDSKDGFPESEFRATTEDIARAIHSRLRGSDAVAVIHPNKLLIILTPARRLQAKVAAERIRSSLIPGSIGKNGLGLSEPHCALFVYPDDANDAQLFLELAKSEDDAPCATCCGEAAR